MLMVATVAGLGGYLLAGGNHAEEVSKSMTESINNVLTQFTANLSNTEISEQHARQELKPSFVGATIDCNVHIEQTMKSRMQALSHLSNEQLSTLSSQITNKLKEALAQKNKQIVSGLALGKNESIQVIDTSSITENNIQTNLKTSIQNVLQNTNDGVQVQVALFDDSICRHGASITISQTMIIQQISKNMAENIVNSVVTNEAKNELEKQVTQKNEQTVKGWALGFVCVCALCCICSSMSTGVAYVKAKKMLPMILMIIGFFMILAGSSSIYLSQQDAEDIAKEYETKYEKAARGFLVSGIIFILFGLLLLGVGGAMLIGGYGRPELNEVNEIPKLPNSMSLPRVG